MRQRNIGQCTLRRHALLRTLGRYSGKHVTAAQRRRLRQQLTQAAKAVTPVADGVGKYHVHLRIAAFPRATTNPPKAQPAYQGRRSVQPEQPPNEKGPTVFGWLRLR